MIKSPFINAGLAIIYISLVSTFVFNIGRWLGNKPDTILAPLAMISLFTLSAAVMGYLFLANPLTLYLDGHKREAVNFFLQTVLTFAMLTVIVFVLLFLAH